MKAIHVSGFAFLLDEMEGRSMNTNSKQQLVTREGSRPASAEQRLKELGIKLPAPPRPNGARIPMAVRGEWCRLDNNAASALISR